MSINGGTFLFKVEDTFAISGRGLILVPGPGDKIAFVKSGAAIRLIRPDQSEIRTVIKGISFEGNHDILIPLTVAKAEVPVGTEVWTVD